MSEDPPTVAACQLPVDDLDVAANRDRVVDTIRDLPRSVDLAVFPEQVLTGFVPDERVHEAAIGRDADAVRAVHDAAENADLGVVVGFVEDAPSGVYNAAAYLDPAGETTVYRKRHLWADEQSLLDGGTDHVRVETPAGRASIATCYDLNFVGDSAATVAEDVDLLIVPGAWPAAYSENWRLLVRARALDGVRWAIAAGRTGRRDVPDAPTATYAGRSLVTYPNGEVKTALTRDPGTTVSDLDPDTLARARDRVGIFGGN
jgi:(R)-amidase